MLAHKEHDVLTRKKSPMQRGFTVVEMMVAVAILGLMLLVAMPSIGTWLANIRIRNTAESLQNGLQLARNEAVRRNQSISFYLVALTDPTAMSNTCTLSDTSGSWVVSVESPANKCGTAPSSTTSPKIVAARAAGGNGGSSVVKALHDAATVSNVVTFNGFGRVTNTTTGITSIQVLGPDADTNSTIYRPLNITVSNAGAVRMCDPSTNLPSTDPRRC